MNYNEIIAKLAAAEIGPEQIDEMAYSAGDVVGELKDEFGEVTLIAEHGGEGEGEEYWKVFHFADHDTYIKYDARYTSYEGVEWDGVDFYEVHPKSKTITYFD